MKLIIFDLLRADEFLSGFVFKDSSRNRKAETVKMYDQVFRLHKVTKEEFFKSYTYYQEHPDKNRVMFDSLHKYVNRLKIEPPLKPVKVVH